MMGIAYKLLVDNGLMDLSPQFTASVVLMCAGTALLFFSLSGFLVRMAKLIPSLYLRGLAPFTVQQLASRVNTAFASLTVVCMVLSWRLPACAAVWACATPRATCSCSAASTSWAKTRSRA